MFEAASMGLLRPMLPFITAAAIWPNNEDASKFQERIDRLIARMDEVITRLDELITRLEYVHLICYAS
jgi:hypothetical protein